MKAKKEPKDHQRVLEYELTLRLSSTKLENLDDHRIRRLIADRLSGLQHVIGSRTPVEVGVGIRVKPASIEEQLASLQRAVDSLMSGED